MSRHSRLRSAALASLMASLTGCNPGEGVGAPGSASDGEAPTPATRPDTSSKGASSSRLTGFPTPTRPSVTGGRFLMAAPGGP